MRRLFSGLVVVVFALLSGCASAPDPTPVVAPGPVALMEPGIYRVADGQRLERDAFFEELRRYRVVFVGERHDNVVHHEIQGEILEGLSRKIPGGVALGMEMFQTPYQEPLDAYVRGDIDAEEMLKRTEYKKRWGFDFDLYRPLMELMRLQGSGIAALNAPSELTRKISREGVAALSEEEKALLPPNYDHLSEEHREMIRKVFAEFHAGMDEETFERFYTAQVVWDATMASSSVNFLGQHRDLEVLVVIAGMYHVQYGLGIPLRLGLYHESLESVVVIPVAQSRESPASLEDFLETKVGDYVWVEND